MSFGAFLYYCSVIRFSIILLFGCLFSSSCDRKWTEKDKSEFVGGCMSRQAGELGAEKAKSYCQCLLEKVVQKYPNAYDAPYIKYDTALKKLATDCLGAKP